MTQEEKEILLKDLCAMLPYNVVINCTEEDDEKTNFNCILAPDMIKDIKSETAYWIIKPYLRPMSSMTDEEREEYENLCLFHGCKAYSINTIVAYELIDWLNKHHFDYRGLIQMGLALEATEWVYELKH